MDLGLKTPFWLRVIGPGRGWAEVDDSGGGGAGFGLICGAGAKSIREGEVRVDGGLVVCEEGPREGGPVMGDGSAVRGPAGDMLGEADGLVGWGDRGGPVGDAPGDAGEEVDEVCSSWAR